MKTIEQIVEASGGFWFRILIAVLILVAFVLIVIGISRDLSAITGSTSPSPRRAAISAQHVVVATPAEAIALLRPSYSGLQDGPQATISSMSAWTLDDVARCAGLCCGALGLAPKNVKVLPEPPPSMGPPCLGDFHARMTCDAGSSPKGTA